MEPPGGRDSRFNLGYSMNLLSGETSPEIYGNPNLGRPSTSLQQLSPRHTMVGGACGTRGGGGGGGGGALKTDMYDERAMSAQGMGLDTCVSDISEDTYGSMQSKKSPPSNGKKTKGRVKIKMEYIENKLRRYTTFSKRKTGIMKKAYELSTLTGTQVMLLVASETGHVYTFATRKLQPMITSEAGKALIQTCLNSPDPPAGSAGGDQRMSATGFEETELTYNISDDDSKDAAESGTSESSEEVEENCTDPLEIAPNFTSEPNLDQQPFSLPVVFQEANPVIVRDKPQVQKQPKATSFEMKIEQKPEPIDGEENEQEEEEPQPQLQRQQQQQSNVPLVETTVNSSSSTFPLDSNPSTSTVESIQGAQAVPLLLQTPNGMVYASTPEGMLLGLLQGPNMLQPQLVSLPLTVTSYQNQNSDIKKG